MAEAHYPQKRRFTRISFFGPAAVEFGSVRVDCSVLDVSLKGVLIDAPPTVTAKVGDHCTVFILLGSGEAQIKMTGLVDHATGRHERLRSEE
jgi:hypothetical protein